MTAIVLLVATAVGLVASSIGILAVIAVEDMRIRIEGGMTVAVGVACIVVSNLDSIAPSLLQSF